ncbi:MAG: tetratricopeptide repeat protein [Anaerolineaceae bacterium]|nr:tetratricopeptide repeat protein [Anaerolineaceae bacterium]
MKIYLLIALLLWVVCGCTTNPAERNNVGNGLYDQADYDGAIKAYQAAQVAAPDNAEAYYNSASAYSQAGELDKAVDALKQALKFSNPDLIARTYYNLGNVYFGMRRFDDAVVAYQQVLLLHPDNEDARHNLELALKKLVVASPTPTLLDDAATEEADSGGLTPTAVPTTSSNEATASPDSLDSQLNTLTPPVSNETQPTFSVDDAQRILDAVQQAQQPFPNSALSATPASIQSGKDW